MRKKMVTEKKVGGPSVVVIVRSCCSPSAANIMTLTNFRSFHKRSISLEMRLQAENIISPILNCHAAAAAEAEKPGWQGSIATRKVFARPESFCAYKRKNLLNCLNTFKTIRIFPDDFQFSGWFQNCPDFFPDDCQFSG